MTTVHICNEIKKRPHRFSKFVSQEQSVLNNSAIHSLVTAKFHSSFADNVDE